MKWEYLIILGIALAAVLIVFAIVMWLINNREERRLKKTPHYRHDVIISGGVDINTGQMKRNAHQYFNGMNDADFETICITTGQTNGVSGQIGQNHSLVLLQKSTGRQLFGHFNTEIIIGRSPSGDGTPTLIIDNDKSVSGRHCKVCVNNGVFTVEDLGSANHTYLNGVMVTDKTVLTGGAYLKIGSEIYKAFLN